MFKLSRKTGMIALLVVLLAAAVLGFGYQNKMQSQKTFFGDGYIVTLEETQEEALAQPVYVQAGSSYTVRYPGQITFKDTSGLKKALPLSNFVHFADGSISSLTGGVVMEMGELKNGLVNYYNVSDLSVMERQNEGYVLNNQGTQIPFSDFVWKLSDDKYLISSPQLSVKYPNGQQSDVNGYVELNYIDAGVIQIVGEELAYQGLTTGASVVLRDGMSVDVGNRMVRQGEEDILSLNALTLNAGTNLTVIPEEDLDLKVPKFDITTIDGVNGELGEEGVQGVEGEAGEEGETGAAGELGENGEAGEKGVIGSGGSGGSTGSSGSSGATGTNGAGGKSGGTGGSAGGGDGNAIVMPTVSLSKFDYTAGSVSGTIDAGEGTNVVLREGTIEIIDLSTGKAVHKDSTGDMDSNPSVDFSYENLDPDKEYRLRFSSEYEITVEFEDDTATTGTREFISRVFSTSGYGISETYKYATKNSLTVEIEKKEYSDLTSATIICSDGTREDARELTFQAGGAGKETITFQSLTPNTQHKIRIEVPTDAGKKEISVHEYMTLKESPEMGLAPTVSINPRGYFELRPASDDTHPFSDIHHGVISYRYEIYTARGTQTLQTSINTDTTSAVSAYIDGTNIQRDTYYVAKLVAEFDDNEKIVEYSTGFTEEFIMSGSSGAPYMSFTDMKATNGESGVNFESVKGNLNFNANSADLDASAPVRITMYSEAFFRESEIVTLSGGDIAANGFIDKELDLKGLRKTTTYRFNAYGRYRGDTKESLLATCIVTTPQAETITVHMKLDEEIQEGIAARVYFTNEAGEAVPGRSATTVRKMVVTLQDSTTKYPPVPITFDSTEENPYYGSNFVNYYGEDHGYLITNGMLGVPTPALKDNANYTMTIDSIYDYTVEDEYRYDGSVNTYTNQIPLAGTTSLSVKKQLMAPSLPEVPLRAQNIENSQLTQFGLEKVTGLADDTVVGIVLNPNYDNSSQFATSFSYYLFDQKTYGAKVGSIPDEEAKSDPLLRNRDSCLLKYDYDLKSVTPGSDGLLPKLIVFFSDVNLSGNTEGEISRDSSAASEWKGIRYIAADAYNPQLKDNNKGTRLGRGERYTYAYDLILNLNGNTEFRYPYDYETNDGKGYTSVSQILRVDGDAPRMKPEFLTYPYDMNVAKKTASWKIKVKRDPDQALRLDSFRVSGGSGSPNIVSDTLQKEADKNPDFDLPAFMSEAFQEIKFEEVQGPMLNLNVVYNAYGKGADAETAVKSVLYQDYQTAPAGMKSDIVDHMNLAVRKNTDDNTLAFTITPDASLGQEFFNDLDRAAGLHVKVTGTQVTDTTEFYIPLTKGTGQYTASLPLTEISEYAGDLIAVDTRVVYEKSSFGYAHVSKNKGDRYALQDQKGNFYIPDTTTGTLKAVSSIHSSLYGVPNGAELTDSGISFAYAHSIAGSSFGATMRLNFTEGGAMWPGAKVSETMMVLKPLEETGGAGWSEIEVDFDSMVPVISNVNQKPGLNSIEVAFNLTKNIESLLATTNPGGVGSGKYVIIRLEELMEDSTYKHVKTVYVPCATLMTAPGKAVYKFEELKLNTKYKAIFSGVLGTDAEATIFRDISGKPTYIEMQTLDKVTISFTRGRYDNFYYNNRYMTFVYNLDTLDGIKIRYSVDDVTVVDQTEQVYDHVALTTGDHPILTVPEIQSLEGNILRMTCAPPTKIKYGHSYQFKISVYTEKADFNNMTEEQLLAEKVGEKSSPVIVIPEMTAPVARITASMTPGATSGNGDDYTKQKMSVSINMVDSNNVIVSPNTAVYEFKGLNGTITEVRDPDGNALTASGLPDKEALKGYYMIKIEEREYASSSSGEIPTDRWRPIGLECVETPFDGSKYGLSSVQLKNLKPDRDYRVRIYVSTNPELEDGVTSITEEMIEDGTAYLAGEYIQHTMDEKGIYIDDATTRFTQVSSSQVSMTMYNPAGLDKVGYMRCDFIPYEGSPDNAVYSGLLDWKKDVKVEESAGTNGVTKVTASFPASFQETGDYFVVLRMYNHKGEAPENLLYSIAVYNKLLTVYLGPAKADNSASPIGYTYPSYTMTWEEKRRL